MTAALPNQRHLFDIPDDVAYFNCAYMGPLLRSSAEAVGRAVKAKMEPWRILASDFFSDIELIRGLFAQLIGAKADDVALIPSASYGMGAAAANLPLTKGQSIIHLADQFPSNVYPWRRLAAETGGQIRVIDRPADNDWTSAVLAAIDDATAIVALPHCHWTDGGLIDLARIGRACRQAGAALAIDATQSLGVLPLDVGLIKPDFLVASSYKWLLGPYGFGYLYVDPKWHQGHPLEENWICRAEPENFAGLVDYRDEYAPGARRYDFGERSSFFLAPAAKTALEQILDWGPGLVEAIKARADEIIDRAGELGLLTLPAEYRAPHLVGLRFPDGAPNGLLEALAQRKVYVSLRGDSVRVAPHVYNTAADIDRLIESLAEVV